MSKRDASVLLLDEIGDDEPLNRAIRRRKRYCRSLSESAVQRFFHQPGGALMAFSAFLSNDWATQSRFDCVNFATYDVARRRASGERPQVSDDELDAFSSTGKATMSTIFNNSMIASNHGWHVIKRFRNISVHHPNGSSLMLTSERDVIEYEFYKEVDVFFVWSIVFRQVGDRVLELRSDNSTNCSPLREIRQFMKQMPRIGNLQTFVKKFYDVTRATLRRKKSQWVIR